MKRVVFGVLLSLLIAVPTFGATKAKHTKAIRLIEAVEDGQGRLVAAAEEICVLVEKIEGLSAGEKALLKGIVDNMDDLDWNTLIGKLQTLKQFQSWVQSNLGWAGCP